MKGNLIDNYAYMEQIINIILLFIMINVVQHKKNQPLVIKCKYNTLRFDD